MSLQNEKMQSTFNIESSQVKEERLSKPSDLKTTLVVKNVSPTTCGNLKEVHDLDKSSLEVGSIVSVNGRNLDASGLGT